MSKGSLPDVALEAAAQLALDVARDRNSVGNALAPACQPGLEVLLHEPVERCAFGTATFVVDHGAIGRPLGLPGDGLHALLTFRPRVLMD